MLTGCKLKVFVPKNVECEITLLDEDIFHEDAFEYNVKYASKIYLVNAKSSNKMYFARLEFSGGFAYFKIKFELIENGKLNPQEIKGMNVDIVNSNLYRVYKLSEILNDFPYDFKIIRTDKNKWQNLCNLVINEDTNNAPISSLVNVSDLKRFIYDFF